MPNFQKFPQTACSAMRAFTGMLLVDSLRRKSVL